MKFFFLLILFISSLLNATPIININSDNTKLTDFKLEYFNDKSSLMTLQDVKEQNFTEDRSTLSLGAFQENTWLRFKLHNTTNRAQKLYIHNENGYIANTLKFYELLDTKTINTLEIILANKKDTEVKMFGTDAVFSLNLEVNQTKTIYIKSIMKVMQYPHFTIYSELNSKKRVSQNNSLLFVILGMCIALALYHFLLYTTTKYKEYLYYSLYLSAAATWEFLLSGMMANNFGIYFNYISDKFLLSIILLPFFIALFSKSIFDTKNHYIKEDKLLNSLLLFSIFMFIFGLFNLHLSLVFSCFFYIYAFGVLFLTTYNIMKKGNPFALTFLLANALFSLFMMITNLYYLGYVNYSAFAFNSASIGIVLEALVLSLLLSNRIKHLQKSKMRTSEELIISTEKSREKDKILFQQTKMHSMGEMLENIAHQWRQPLAQVNASVLTIDNILYDKYGNDKEIEKELINIETLTTYMSKTIDSFRKFFDENKEAKEFSIKDVISSSVLILGKSLGKDSLIVHQNISSKFNYFGYENEFQQVILIILNNAKEALDNKKIKNPQITITVKIVHQDFRISICDNAGGIDRDIMPKIFDPYFTTKHKSQGTGLGLYMSKMIIEDNMSGQLNVRNIVDGACFSIVLKPNKYIEEE